MFGTLVVVAVVVGTRAVRADGAFPDSLTIVVPADRPHRLALATNFGLISSDDDGAAWSWVCEGPLTSCSTLYSASAAPVDRLYALSADRLVFSDDDACDWSVAGGAVSAGGVVDAFPLAQDGQRVLAVLSPNGVGRQTTYTVVESRDGGTTFGAAIYVAASGDLVTGVEASRTDASTIYVTLVAGPTSAPAVAVTRDGGAHWSTTDLSVTLGAQSSIGLVAVDRANPGRVFLRVGMLAGDGLGVFDVASGAVTVPLMFTGGLMTAFVQTAEGPLVAAGRIPSGASLARSLDGGASWQPVSAAPNARALAERDGKIYVAADDIADGYALGVSADLGVTFAPLMRFDQVGSIAPCARAACQSTCQNQVALGLWPAATCTAAPERGPQAAGGGGCGLGGSAGSAGAGFGGVALLWALARRPWNFSASRRRRRRDGLEAHRDAAARAQGDERLRDGDVAGHEVKLEALGHGRQHELGLHEREVVADALPRTAAERKVIEAVRGGGALAQESLGVETFRVRPARLSAVRDVGAQHDDRTRGDMVSAHDVVADGAARDDPGRWIEAQRLLDHGGRVGQVSQVVVARRAARENLQQLATQAPGHRRVERQ
ncbi:MAG TPA: sialidase family protein [Polyangia bacterium]|nr:sialidase family protein [Polyangia bacterium]